MTDKYKLTLFLSLRNTIMASPCPGNPKIMMVQKYDKKHINALAYRTMLHCIDMVDFDLAKKSFEEGKMEYEKAKSN